MSDIRTATIQAFLERPVPMTGLRADAGALEWSSPVDLWAKFDPPELPQGSVPEVIERFALEHGALMGADPAGLAMAALTICGAAIPDRIKLQAKVHD